MTDDDTKNFALAIGQMLVARDPKRTTVNMAKAERNGRVFVDWSQNDRHKTTICAYSLRIAEHPYVSTPITWDEVHDALDRGDRDALDVRGAGRARARRGRRRPLRRVAHRATGATRAVASRSWNSAAKLRSSRERAGESAPRPRCSSPSAGCKVVCAARATDAAPVPIPGTIDETVRRIRDAGGEAIAVPTNLAKDAEVEHMIAATVEQLGPVDVLVNNAAITFPGDLDLDMKRFDLVMQVDLRAPLVAIRAVMPSMKARRTGAILNVSSIAGLNYFPGLMSYGMAKAALEHLTVSAAHQLRPFDIAVNTFRIDVPVASEGFVFNLPDADHSDWEPSEVAAEGIVWMLEQPPSYTGHNVGMARLRADQGIMASRAARPHAQQPALVTDTHLRPLE